MNTLVLQPDNRSTNKNRISFGPSFTKCFFNNTATLEMIVHSEDYSEADIRKLFPTLFISYCGHSADGERRTYTNLAHLSMDGLSYPSITISRISEHAYRVRMMVNLQHFTPPNHLIPVTRSPVTYTWWLREQEGVIICNPRLLITETDTPPSKRPGFVRKTRGAGICFALKKWSYCPGLQECKTNECPQCLTGGGCHYFHFTDPEIDLYCYDSQTNQQLQTPPVTLILTTDAGEREIIIPSTEAKHTHVDLRDYLNGESLRSFTMKDEGHTIAVVVETWYTY